MTHSTFASRCGRIALFAAVAGLPLAANAARDYGSRDYGYGNSYASTNFYAGGGLGYNKFEGEDFTDNGGDEGIEDERVTYKGVIGLKLNRMWALEAQYIDFGTAEGNDSNLDARGFTAGAVATFPIWRYVQPYAKAGAFFWDTEGRFENRRFDDDGVDPTYGAGLRIPLSNRLDVRTEYEAFELNETDIDHLSATVQFHF